MQDSWADYLYTKCHNLNREPPGKSGSSSSSSDIPRPKRIKLTTKHDYPNLEEVEDEVSNQRNKELLRNELIKVKPNKEALTSFMRRTASVRRKCILDGGQGVREICEEWPLLKKYSFVSNT